MSTNTKPPSTSEDSESENEPLCAISGEINIIILFCAFIFWLIVPNSSLYPQPVLTYNIIIIIIQIRVPD